MRWLIPKGTVEEEGSGQPPWRNGTRGGHSQRGMRRRGCDGQSQR